MADLGDLEVGDLVRIIKGDMVLEGIVMPATEFTSNDVIILKLSNGYNVGVSIRDAKVKVIKKSYVSIGHESQQIKTCISGRGKLKLSLVSTGGTIVSKVEYETGAVKPALTAPELIELAPELLDEISELEVIELFRLLSEDLTPSHWSKIAEEVAKKIESGASGVIVAHGTDTISYTAAALAFALRNLPCPVMLVGAQRSSDRPSTDSVLNLRACPVIASRAPFGEVVVVMHGHTSDSYVLAHRGVKVRKMHSSRRDAFQSINDVPLARVDFPEKKFKLLNKRYLSRSEPQFFIAKTKFSSKVALIKAYPGLDCELIDYLVDKGYEGIVIEGTGLGHVRQECINAVKRACEDGVVIVMTSQTLFGRVNMKVYTNGRKLILAGVVPGSDMIPETAYAKLSWLLANVEDRSEVKSLMMRNLVNEINEIHDIETYPRWFHG